LYYIIGIGYTQLNEFLSGLEIFPMSSKTYSNIETTLDTEIKNTAWFEMQKAGQEEKKIAIELGIIKALKT